MADPADLEEVFTIEALTDDRIRGEVGSLQLVAPDDRIARAGAGYIMAAVTHVSLIGGRFTDGSYRDYAARDLRRPSYHRSAPLERRTRTRFELDLRILRARLEADLHDLRRLQPTRPEFYHPDDYLASQVLAR